MSENLSQRAELLRYLESQRGLYPVGIPIGLLKPQSFARVPLSKSLERLLFRHKVQHSELVQAQGKVKSKLMFVRFELEGKCSDNFSDAGGKLLQSAIERGLKLKTSEVFVTTLSKGVQHIDSGKPFYLEHLELFKENLIEEIKHVAPIVVVLLGAELADAFGLDKKSKWVELGGAKALISLNVSAVANDPTLKKSFWEDLKLLV